MSLMAGYLLYEAILKCVACAQSTLEYADQKVHRPMKGPRKSSFLDIYCCINTTYSSCTRVVLKACPTKHTLGAFELTYAAAIFRGLVLFTFLFVFDLVHLYCSLHLYPFCPPALSRGLSHILRGQIYFPPVGAFQPFKHAFVSSG